MKHTPGPWIIQTNVNNDMLYEVTDSLTESVIIAGPWPVPLPMVKGGGTDTRFCNARLIAAAPDLLATLVAVFEFHREEYGNGPLTRRMETAITKATGGTR
jgi:hypothetical protein